MPGVAVHPAWHPIAFAVLAVTSILCLSLLRFRNTWIVALALVILAVVLALIPGEPTSRTKTIGARTIGARAFTSYSVPSGTHDVIYENCSFTSSGAQTAALFFNEVPAYDITFDNCTFQSTNWNDVSINVTNAEVHDVTFENCDFLPSGRMDFECNQRPVNNSTGYEHIDLIDDTFEPCHDEAISFDGGFFAMQGVIVSGCTINGSDNAPTAQFPTEPAWGGAIECNGPTGFVVENTHIYACKTTGLNIEGPAGRPSNDIFRNVVVNWSVLIESVPTDSTMARLMSLNNVNGALFDNCTFNTGTPANHAWNAGYFTDSSNNDFSTSTITGVVTTVSGPVVPATAAGYFSLDSASTGNKLPAKQ
jgi:hypothetical protein